MIVHVVVESCVVHEYGTGLCVCRDLRKYGRNVVLKKKSPFLLA